LEQNTQVQFFDDEKIEITFYQMTL